MKKSEHIFLIVEDLLPKKIEDKILKQADKVEEVKGSPKNVKYEKEFNIFSLTDALADKNNKLLWTLFQKARIAGVSAEEILPILFWQIKTQLLVKLSSNHEAL